MFLRQQCLQTEIGRALQGGTKASFRIRDPGARHLQVTENVRAWMAELVASQKPCFGKGAGSTDERKLLSRAELVA